jgi:hypothetical protein
VSGPIQKLAATLRAMADEELVLAAWPWVEERIGGVTRASAITPVRATALPPKRGLGRPKPVKPVAHRKAVGGRHGPAEVTIKNAERAFKVLAASEAPLPLGALMSALGLGDGVAVSALRLLRKQGRASSSGKGSGARWSVAL